MYQVRDELTKNRRENNEAEEGHRLQLHRNLRYSNGIDCLATDNGRPIPYTKNNLVTTLYDCNKVVTTLLQGCTRL